MKKQVEETFTFPQPTKQETEIAAQIFNDLQRLGIQPVLDKFTNGTFTLNEPISRTIIAFSTTKLPTMDDNSTKLLKAFLKELFLHFNLDATYFVLNHTTTYPLLELVVALGAPLTATMNGRDVIQQQCHVRTADRQKRFELLVKHGADFNFKTPVFGTEAHIKIANELPEDIDFFFDIINKHAKLIFDFTSQDGEGKTVLILAVKIRSKIIFDRIIKEYIDRDRDIGINNCDNKGRTALHYACILGHLEMVEELISLGANLKAQDKSGKTPRDYLNCKPKIISTVLDEIQIDPKRDEKAWRNNLVTDHVRSPLYIDSKEIPSRKATWNNIYTTAIKMSYSPDECQTVMKQLASFTGRSILDACIAGHTALNDFFKKCDDKFVQNSIQNKAHTIKERRQKINNTLFRNAAMIGNIHDVQRLLKDESVDVNAKSEATGFNALHNACDRGNYEVIKLILSMPNLRILQQTKSGKTAFQLFKLFHKGKATVPDYYAVHQLLFEQTLSAMHQAKAIPPGKIVRTDFDGNFHFHDTQEEAQAAANNEVNKSGFGHVVKKMEHASPGMK